MNRESINEVTDNIYYTYDGSEILEQHNATKSIRECIIVLFELIIGYIDKKRDSKAFILFQARELLNIIDDENHYYSCILPEVLELNRISRKETKRIVYKRKETERIVDTRRYLCILPEVVQFDRVLKKETKKEIKRIVYRRKKKKKSLLLSEKSVIRQLAEGIIGEYYMQTNYTKIDFCAMRVLCELGQQIFKSGILNEKNINSITIIVDNDELKSWTLRYSDIDSEEENFVFIDWVDLNNINHFNQINNISLFGLSNGSRSNLTTAMAIEKEFTNIKNDIFSYNSLAILYLGIIERELGLIIRQLDCKTEYKQLMWNDITHYCKNNLIPLLSENLPLYEILKELRPIRNRVAHGEFIEEEEFKKVKQLTHSNQLIEFISRIKVDLGMVSENDRI